MAAGSGRIVFRGYTRGYGNLIKEQYNSELEEVLAKQAPYKTREKFDDIYYMFVP